MSNKSGGGIGFIQVLFLVFLVLKLTGYISWSWWWVTSPLWLGFVLFAVFVLFCLGFSTTLKMFKGGKS